MLRRLAVEAIFANLLALFMLALVLSGCSLQQNPAERPDWSLTSTDRPADARAQMSPSRQRYGDWSGPGAPKPLTY